MNHEPTTFSIDLPTLAATVSFGSRLAAALRAADVVGLVGDLGAGKTTLVQAVARGLGVPDGVPVTSPTFTLHQVYPGRVTVHHFDLYRIETEADVVSLGLDDVLGKDGVALVEWFDRLGKAAPPDVLVVSLALTGTDSRRAEIRADGPRSRAIAEAL